MNQFVCMQQENKKTLELGSASNGLWCEWQVRCSVWPCFGFVEALLVQQGELCTDLAQRDSKVEQEIRDLGIGLEGYDSRWEGL